MSTCDTCRYWQPTNLVRGVIRGDCDSGDLRLPCPTLDLSDYRPVLVTRADFGCVAHTPIDEPVAIPVAILAAPEAPKTR